MSGRLMRHRRGKEDDYEIIRGNAAAAGAWHESRLRRQSLHQQATPRGHELVTFCMRAVLSCPAAMSCHVQVSRQKQALNTAAAAWYLIAESSGRGRELPIG